MISFDQADRIRQAFGAGQLRVQSVSPSGDVEWKRVEHTHKNPVPWEHIYEHQTENGPMVSTGGHSVYTSPTTTVLSESLCSGDVVLGAEDGVLTHLTIQKAQRLPSRPFMYDLTVEDHHNFILHRSKVVVHNCPDRHYHFNPPEHESQIGQYNRVFGFVWEDLELREYLRSALDTWNMYPPNTAATTPSLDAMLQNRFTSAWGASIKWGAIAYAMFALTRNWIQDEFSYSIGGISLDINKSSSYEGLKNNAEGRFDATLEAKKDTVKYIRGLKQSKYGVGIRSAFGPHLSSGTVSPRNFI